MKQQSIDRLRFLSRSGNAGAGLVLAGLSSTARLRGASLNDAIEVGVVGPGGRGTSLMKLVAKLQGQHNARITAVCDAWNQRREKAAERVKQTYGTEPKVCRHINEILQDDQVDAVMPPGQLKVHKRVKFLEER